MSNGIIKGVEVLYSLSAFSAPHFQSISSKLELITCLFVSELHSMSLALSERAVADVGVPVVQ